MLRDVEDGLSEVAIGGMGRHDSTRNDVRRAADAAIRAALSADIANDDGCAVPSDAYLDRPSSGLMGAVGGSILHAGIMRAVPSMFITGEDDATHGGSVGGEEEDYTRILDALLVANNATDGGLSSSIDDLEGRARGGAGGDGDGEDARSVHTTTSQLSSAISVSSSGSRMTAQQRRRWHKQRNTQVLHGNSKVSTNSTSRAMIPAPLYTHVEFPSRHRANIAAGAGGGAGAQAYNGRQQSHLGSMPYLCEVLHDAYGIGSHPPVGLLECDGYSPSGTRETGTEFYPPSNHVTDVYVFNTSRNSYGPTSTNTTNATTTTKTTVGLSAAGPTFGKCSSSNRSTGGR
jgi:hypothetical protein